MFLNFLEEIFIFIVFKNLVFIKLININLLFMLFNFLVFLFNNKNFNLIYCKYIKNQKTLNFYF